MVIKQPETVTAIIEKAKRELIDKTNICDSPEEMQVLSDMMFRLWQMGWLDKIFQETEPVKKGRWLSKNGEFFFCSRCRHEAYDVQDGRQIGVLLSPWCPECGARMDTE